MTPARLRALMVLVPALLLWIGATWVERRENTLQVRLACEGDLCEATVDGGEPFEIEIPGGRWATRMGLYVFHPWERPGSTAFRNFHIDRTGTGLRPYDLSLTELEDSEWFDDGGDDAWRLRAGHGLIHRGELGTRGLLAFAPPTDNDFNLSVEIVDPVDAGIMFRGYDAENTWLFVVRSAYNDAFFCRMHRGEIGEITALRPLRELSTAREALRLGGLLGCILTVAGLVLLSLRALFAGRWWSRIAGSMAAESRRPSWVRPAAAAMFVATIVACGAVSFIWLDAIPHLVDESAYLFQSRVFAAGQLWAQPPEHPQFFEHEQLIVQGERWFSKYPPLFSALLALGVLLGAPWLVNPFLAACTGWLVYRLGCRLAGPLWGLLAWALLLASPFFVVMGATFMAHMLAALLTAAFLLCLFHGLDGTSGGWWFGAGCCLSLAIVTRPYTAFLVALAAAPFVVAHLVRRRSWRITFKTPAALLAGVLPGIVLFFVWGALHADPANPSLNLYAQNNSSDTLGFGPDKGADWLKTWGTTGHTPAKAMRATHQYLDYTSRHLFGWPVRLSLALALAGFGWSRRRRDAWLLALVPLALVVGHGFYWATQHLAYGARYWFSALPAIALLSVLGIRALVEAAEPTGRRLAAQALGALVLILVAYNAVAYFPKQLAQLPRFAGITANLAREIERLGVERGVVFVRTQESLFNDGFYLNDPSDPNATVFARDMGKGNAPLRRQYAEREAWLWNGSRLTPMDPIAEVQP